MKAKQVLEMLRVTRVTLTRYVKNGKIQVIKMHNNQYDYNDADVFKLVNKNIDRKIVIYGRVSTIKQKKDLENQLQLLKQYSFTKGYQISNIYSDISSGISFEKRKDFFLMLDEVIQGKIVKVIISYKDRLSRVGFGLFKYLFSRFNCEIEVMSEIGDSKLDSEEIFEEIVSLLHCYSMKLYSKRKNKKITIEQQ